MTFEHSKILGDLYEKYSKYLIRFAYGKLNDWYAAEDVVQRTFEIACRKENILDSDIDAKSWLIDILILELKNYWRASNIRNKYFGEFESGKEYASPDSEIMFDNIDYIKPRDVSDKDFAIVKYVSVYGLSCAEAAKMLGISEAACYKRYQRAKKRIREKFEK